MGFYDCRCMVSGVSLKGAKAVSVLLLQSDDRYRPVALGIKGSYNRYGTIDFIEEDTNTEFILKFFHEKYRSGEFAVDPYQFSPGRSSPTEDIEGLLYCFERNINDGGDAQLNRQFIVLALICSDVWNALVRRTPPGAESPDWQFGELFRGVSIPWAIYRHSGQTLSQQVGELYAVNSFLANRGIAWRLTEADGQHYDQEMLQYLEEAKYTFQDSGMALEALKKYEEKLQALLDDDE
jgi:hypothetical protein